MKASIGLPFKQPISLKVKWGVLLFLGFYTVGFFGLLLYHRHLQASQRQALMATYQNQFETTVNYLENFTNLYADEESTLDGLPLAIGDNGTNLDPAIYHYFAAQESPEITYRIFNHNNQLIYASRHVTLSNIDPQAPLQFVDMKGLPVLVASSPVYSNENGQFLGNFQYVVQAGGFGQIEVQQDRFFLRSLLLLILISGALAWLVSMQFLRPLSYLNNALDMVEEENLSELRMRKPRSADEWSDLTIHINRLLDKIELYVKNQKQFVEDVSHELRTPVAIVEGHLTMLNRWGKNDPEILEESISASLQEISRMKGLVQEMLDLMRADHAEVDYKDEITEISSTTRQVYNNFVMLYPNFQFYLDADKEGSEVYIRMFRNHFEQVLIILLDNAVKYSLDRKEIHLSVSTTLSNVEIAVQDFGEGMTEEDKERVFGRFYRVDKARARDKGGNGLGLSIAQQLVQSYKGAIRVESVLGHGSIFYVTFPILTDNRQIYKSKQKSIEKNL